MSVGRGKKAPIGTVRYWESQGQVIKASESSIFTDGWLPVNQDIPTRLREKAALLDRISNDILKFKDPVDGEIWLLDQMKGIVKEDGQKFDISDFKLYEGYYGIGKYSFTSAFFKMFMDKKISEHEYVIELLQTANEDKISSLTQEEKEGYDSGKLADGKVNLLTPEEVKEIRSRGKKIFNSNYTNTKKLTEKDIEEVYIRLKKVKDYLDKGENFDSEEQTELWERFKTLRSDTLEEYQRYKVRVKQFDTLEQEINTLFEDNYGIRETFKKRRAETITEYLRKFYNRIKEDDLKEFEENICKIDEDTQTFYSSIRNYLSSQDNKPGFGEVQENPEILKGYDVSYSSTEKYKITSCRRVGDGYVVEMENIASGQTTTRGFWEDSTFKEFYLSKVQIGEDQINIDLPLKVRFERKFNKDIQGMGLSEITLLHTLENISNYLPDGHFLTNSSLNTITKENSSQGHNSYAHYSSKHKDIYLSNQCVEQEDKRQDSFNIFSGREVGSVIIHEIGHAVSQKFKREKNIAYREFAYLCGWSWSQFPDNKGLHATGNDKDIKREGPFRENKLITRYAHKSPEEAFAEYYSLYSQYKPSIDKFLSTGETRELERTPGLSKSVENFFNTDERVQSFQSKLKSSPRYYTNSPVLGDIEEYLNKTGIDSKLQSDIQLEYISPHSSFREEHLSTKNVTKRDYQDAIKEAKVSPNLVLSVKSEKGEHKLISYIDHISNVGNMSSDYSTPTVSISQGVYSQLIDQGFLDNDIRDYMIKHISSKLGEETIEKRVYKTFKQNKSKEKLTDEDLVGVTYSGEFVPVSTIKSNKEIFEKMKHIWESEELKKSLEEDVNWKNPQNGGQTLEFDEEHPVGNKLKAIFTTALDQLKSIFSNSKVKESVEENGKKKINYADSIVLDKLNRILLLRRNESDEIGSGLWCLPGGKIEEGETPEEGGLRELCEETNIKSDNTSFLLERDLENGSKIFYHQVCVDGIELVGLDNDEHYSYQWVEIEDLVNYDFIFDLKETLLNDILPLVTFKSYQKVNFQDALKGYIAKSLVFEENLTTPENTHTERPEGVSRKRSDLALTLNSTSVEKKVNESLDLRQSPIRCEELLDRLYYVQSLFLDIYSLKLEVSYGEGDNCGSICTTVPTLVHYLENLDSTDTIYISGINCLTACFDENTKYFFRNPDYTVSIRELLQKENEEIQDNLLIVKSGFDNDLISSSEYIQSLKKAEEVFQENTQEMEGEKQYSEEELRDFAKHASTQALERVLTSSEDETMRTIAYQTLQERHQEPETEEREKGDEMDSGQELVEGNSDTPKDPFSDKEKFSYYLQHREEKDNPFIQQMDEILEEYRNSQERLEFNKHLEEVGYNDGESEIPVSEEDLEGEESSYGDLPF